MNTRSLILAMAACALAAPHAASQAAPRPSFCTTAAPPPACAKFLVIETEMGSRVRGSRGELALAWQVGLLGNRGRSAVGAAAYAGFDLDVRADRPVLNSRLGLLPRYRRWLGRGASLDLSAGPRGEPPRRRAAPPPPPGGGAVGRAHNFSPGRRGGRAQRTPPAPFPCG